MDLLGIAPAKLATIFAGAGAAVVVLYLLKLRRREVLVPFTRLWERVLVDRPTSRLFSQLKRLLSLLLQLALLALMVMALGDPRPSGAARTGRSRVVLLDGSASMKATDVPGGRTDAARRAVREMIHAMGGDDRMLIAQMDAEVTALSPMTDDVAALEQALTAYHPRDTGLDLARALRFGTDVARDASHPELVVVGDGAYDEPRDALGAVALRGVPLRFKGVGRRGRNVAIAAFAVRRYPLDKSRVEVLVEVRNWSPQPERVELTLRADGAPLEVTRLALEPGGVAQRVVPDLSGANQSLEARITLSDGTHDDLPADDVAYATLPPRRRAKLLTVTEGNRYLEAALLLDEYLEVTDTDHAHAAAMLAAARYDVAIFDGEVLPVPPGTATILLRPQGVASPLAAEPGFVMAPPGAAIGFDRVERRHPVLRFTSDLEEAHVGRIVRYRTTPEDQVIGASAQGPLLIAGSRGGDRFVALTFDVRESDVPLLVSWPVMLINAMDWFAGDDPAYLSSFRTGDTWRIPVPAGVERAEVEAPDGTRVSVPVLEGRAVYRGTAVGLYRVHAGEAHTLIAANLAEPSESRCAPRATLVVDGVRATAPAGGGTGLRREWWRLLLAAALAILVAEWLTWHRRITV